MGYKTTDGLMRHLRNTGISIVGSTQKRNLLNTGYFHGYKGYRFFKHSQNRLLFLLMMRYTLLFNMIRN